MADFNLPPQQNYYDLQEAPFQDSPEHHQLIKMFDKGRATWDQSPWGGNAERPNYQTITRHSAESSLMGNSQMASNKAPSILFNRKGVDKNIIETVDRIQ